MGWAKLDNPKPSASAGAVPPMAVKVKARETPRGKNRYITFAIGYALCERARFLQKEHRCHLMIGSGADDGKLAIALDDAVGKFTAKRRSDGRYEISVTEHAAAGKFSLIFPPFERHGAVQIVPGGPPVITFDASADILAV